MKIVNNNKRIVESSTLNKSLLIHKYIWADWFIVPIYLHTCEHLGPIIHNNGLLYEMLHSYVVDIVIYL